MKPSSAHGLRAQTEERRNRRGNRAKGRGEEKERESGELVSSSCSSKSDNDGALLPCNAAGKLTTLAELLCINKSVHMSRTARSEPVKQDRLLMIYVLECSLA